MSQFLEKVKNSMHQTFVKTAANVIPALKESKFLTDGVLTPEEFVAAGDLLVHKCPTWTWEAAASEEKSVSWLPKDKQFLLTRNVPCLMRLKAYEGQLVDTESKTVTENDEEWCAPTYANAGATSSTSATSSSAASSSATATTSATSATSSAVGADEGGDDDIPDMEDYDENNLGEAADPAALKARTAPAAPAAAAAGAAGAAATTASATATSTSGDAAGATATPVAPVENDNIMRTRTYDISMTYDKYYQTPKFWLFGYDEARQPLRAEQVFEDISADHAQRTVTIETHLHKNEAWAFIHPCRHAAVMKRIVERQLANGKTPRADQYLFLFLKFISAICPCIGNA